MGHSQSAACGTGATGYNDRWFQFAGWYAGASDWHCGAGGVAPISEWSMVHEQFSDDHTRACRAVWAGGGRLAWRLKLASTTTVKQAQRLVAIERRKVGVLREVFAEDVDSILRFGDDSERAQSMVQKAEEVMSRCTQVEAALRHLRVLRSQQALHEPQAEGSGDVGENVSADDVLELTREEVEMDLGSRSPLAPTRQFRLLIISATGSVVVTRHGAGRQDRHGQLKPLYDVLPELTLPCEVLAGSMSEYKEVQKQSALVAPTLAGLLTGGYDLVTMSPIFGEDRLRYSLVRLSNKTMKMLQAHVSNPDKKTA